MSDTPPLGRVASDLGRGLAAGEASSVETLYLRHGEAAMRHLEIKFPRRLSREERSECLRSLLDAPITWDPLEQTYALRLGLLRFRKMRSERTLSLADESLPRAAMSSPLSAFDPEKAPDEPGIFEVFAGSDPLFVGHTLNIRARLRSHWEAVGETFVPSAWSANERGPMSISVRTAEAAWSSHKLLSIALHRKTKLAPRWNLGGTAA